MIRAHLVASILAILMSATPLAARQTSTWNGLGSSPYDWNLPGNWNPLGVPGSTTIPVLFTDVSAGTVNVSSNVDMCQSITFNNPTTNYTLTSSAGISLTIGSAITMNAGASSIDQINLANVATGSLVFPATTSSFTIANNTTNGSSMVIGPNTVIGTPGTNSGVIFSGPGAIFLTGSFASGSGVVQSGLTKTGPGLLDFTGSGANLGGNLTLNGGTLQLDYTSASPATKLSNGALILDGGALLFLSNPSTPFTQLFAGIVVSAGHTQVTGSGTGTITLNAGAISHNVGGTVDFTPSAFSPTFSVQTSTGNSSGGLLGNGPAFATVNGGTNWAVQSGVVVAGLSGFSVNIFASNGNTDVTANNNPATFTTNSLRFNVPNLSLGLTGTNVLQSGGILVTPTGGGDQITGAAATLVAGGGEFLVHQYSAGPFTIGAAISASAGLTKTGPGTLTLSGNNTGLTGPININRGSLTVSGSTAPVNSSSAINFNYDSVGGIGGLQTFTVALPNSTNGTITPPIRLSAFSAADYGTYVSTGTSTGSTVTLSGVISSSPGLTTSIRFTGDFLNTSGFNLTNTNTFTGNVNLYQGSLGIMSDANFGNSSNQLFLEVDSAQAGGLVFLNSGITVARPIVSLNPTRIVSNGTNSNTISGVISGTGGIYKDGTGTLTITNAANTVTGGVNVLAGTLSLGATGLVPAGNNIAVSSGATFSPGTTSNSLATEVGVLTLNGGTFRVPSGSGMLYYVSQIVSNEGTIDYTGATGLNQIFLFGAVSQTAAITVNEGSTWLSPGNRTTIFPPINGTVPITIAPGNTFINGIALGINSSGSSFVVTGGGTLFQNSDATNVLGMTANVVVAQGSTFRVTDASSNGGVGNLGAGFFELDGGTFSYGGVTATTAHFFFLTANGGTIQVESATAALTVSSDISSIAQSPLTKTGPGTLIIGSGGDRFTSLVINAGIVQTANDNTLGFGPITVNAGGTLSYTGTTSTTRTININSGTLTVAGGTTLTLNGAAINGGFLRGAGTYFPTNGAALTGVTTFASTTINSGPASYTNFTNGGAFTVVAGLPGPVSMNGFTNQGSGTITLGANTQVNAIDFQSDGLLTIVNAIGAGNKTLLTNTGTTPLYFNGGSRTFIGTVGGNAASAGIELNGQNAIVAGGLFVNNGSVTDNSAAGTSTVIADYGALVKGAGQYDNSPQTRNGGKFQAGNSPGVATMGRFVFGPGGVSNYVFSIDDATGNAGPSPDALGHVSGWGLVKAAAWQRSAGPTSGDFVFTADSSHPLTVAIDTLMNPTTVGIDVPGLMADFDPTRSYSWPAVEWSGTYSGPSDVAALNAATNFDTSGFANPVTGTFSWSLDPAGQSLSLTYTPSAVPEPGTLALVGAAFAAGWRRIRRRGGR